MPLIKQIFDARFSNPEIKLPEEALQSGSRGMLKAAGWQITYCCEEDADGLYLDYLASHRMMMGDERMAIHADGRVRHLLVYPVSPISQFYDAEADRLLSNEETDTLNQQVLQELKEKGHL